MFNYRLSDAVSALRRRFAGRRDSEHEQGFIRLAIGSGLFFYFLYYAIHGKSFNHASEPIFVGIMVAFLFASTLIVIHISIYPAISVPRRLFGIALDSATITYFIFSAAEYGAPLYWIYLWIIVDNGFRYGKSYLFFALALSLAGFGAANFAVPFWISNPGMGIGLWLGMLLMSVCISTLVDRLNNTLKVATSVNRTKRQFISSVSHEFHAPLRAINSRANLLLDYWRGDAFNTIWRRFSGRPDSEHEQGFLRIALGSAVSLYLVYYAFNGESFDHESKFAILGILAGFIFAAAIILIHIAIYPGISIPRRLLGILLDIGTITYFLFDAGDYGAPLYCIYLWIIIGNGFRYGKSYLFFALALALAGFGAANFAVPFWAGQANLGVGLWLGMLLVSTYISTLVGRLTNALEVAKSANRAKRQFISSVSHELRTPLNAIIGMTDLLHGTVLTTEQRDMVRSMDHATHMMLSLVEDVLDFSKIEAGKLLIEEIDFDLHQLIHSTVDIFKYQALGRGLRLFIYFDPAVPYLLRGDPHHLRQVLVNLLSNAVKFTNEGHVALRVECQMDTIHSALLRFEIEDTGIGIAADAQEKVFDSFTQADGSITRCYGGTGLGTTISKQLIELNGGRLGLQSVVGIGSTFWFELPLKKQLSNIDQSSFNDLHILLVGFEDEEFGQVSTIEQCRNVSFQRVGDVASAIAGIQREAGAGNPYHVALLNGSLLNIAGFPGEISEISLCDVMSRISVAAAMKTSVILCSADVPDGPSRRRIAQLAGLAAILGLPIESRLLLNALHAAVTARSVAPQTVSPTAAEISEPSRKAQYSILVAEDNPTNCKLIEKILERAGHLCTIVPNGEEALDRIGQEDFDVIVFDMNMPVMNGIEATKAFRFMCAADMRTPVIMFSANVTKEAKEESFNAGVDEFLPKPIHIDSFLAALDRLVQKFNQGQSHRSTARGTTTVSSYPQSARNEIILSRATLAEWESIGEDHNFVDGLLAGFMKDNRALLDRLKVALLLTRFEEVKEILHSIKGAALTIGALSLKAACHRAEMMNPGELKRNAPMILEGLNSAFDQLCEALQTYRAERKQAVSSTF